MISNFNNAVPQKNNPTPIPTPTPSFIMGAMSGTRFHITKRKISDKTQTSQYVEESFAMMKTSSIGAIWDIFKDWMSKNLKLGARFIEIKILIKGEEGKTKLTTINVNVNSLAKRLGLARKDVLKAASKGADEVANLVKRVELEQYSKDVATLAFTSGRINENEIEKTEFVEIVKSALTAKIDKFSQVSIKQNGRNAKQFLAEIKGGLITQFIAVDQSLTKLGEGSNAVVYQLGKELIKGEDIVLKLPTNDPSQSKKLTQEAIITSHNMLKQIYSGDRGSNRVIYDSENIARGLHAKAHKYFPAGVPTSNDGFQPRTRLTSWRSQVGEWDVRAKHGDLIDFLNGGKDFDKVDFKETFLKHALAVLFVTDLGIVNKDIKADNVLVYLPEKNQENLQLKMADWGGGENINSMMNKIKGKSLHDLKNEVSIFTKYKVNELVKINIERKKIGIRELTMKEFLEGFESLEDYYFLNYFGATTMNYFSFEDIKQIKLAIKAIIMNPNDRNALLRLQQIHMQGMVYALGKTMQVLAKNINATIPIANINEYYKLIQAMLNPNPFKRPNILQVVERLEALAQV